jgi:hypothetical protein
MQERAKREEGDRTERGEEERRERKEHEKGNKEVADSTPYERGGNGPVCVSWRRKVDGVPP